MPPEALWKFAPASEQLLRMVPEGFPIALERVLLEYARLSSHPTIPNLVGIECQAVLPRTT